MEAGWVWASLVPRPFPPTPFLSPPPRVWKTVVWHARPSQEYAPEAEKGRDGLATIEISSHLRIKVVGVNRS